MAGSIIGGLIAKGIDASLISAADPVAENCERLKQDFGIATHGDNAEAVDKAGIIIFAVKPQVMAEVCTALKEHIDSGALILSIAAGTTLANMATWLGGERPMVRCMPNTPALLQLGATGAYANDYVSAEQRDAANTILEAIGIVEWLQDEAQLDSVTAVSGSAPAYFFLLLEAMIKAAQQQGLPSETARNLAVQTCIGAGQLASSDAADISELRRRVTSPGGTTERAIASLQNADFEKIVKDAMDACRNRSIELAQ